MNRTRIIKGLAGAAMLLVLHVPLTGLAADKKAELLWLGHSATRITTPGGKVILIDPYLTKNPKTPEKWKNLEALGKIDLILVTHAHGDHLGDAPELAKKHNAPLYAPSGLNDSLMVLGILPPELAPRMNKSGTITPLGPDIKITMVHAEHSSELCWRNPGTDKDEIHVGGEPSGFIIQLENGFKNLPHGRHRTIRRHEVYRRVLQAGSAVDPDRRSLRYEPGGRGVRDEKLYKA